MIKIILTPEVRDGEEGHNITVQADGKHEDIRYEFIIGCVHFMKQAFKDQKERIAVLMTIITALEIDG